MSKKPVVYIGIDPGKHGAVAAIWPSGAVEAWHAPIRTTSRLTNSKLKSGKNKGQQKQRRVVNSQHDLPGRLVLLRTLLESCRKSFDLKATVEQVTSRPRDGKRQAFTFGYDLALWHMALVALKIPYEEVHSSVWRPAMVGAGTTKADSIRVCRELFPQVELPLAKDEARAEAILIAEWRRRKDKNG